MSGFSKKGTFGVLVWAICLAVLSGGADQTAWAQLSPGKLSRPHSHLEGLTRCSTCHKLGSREVQDKCLECHVEIAGMRSTGRGLHAVSDYDRCVDCHVEHHGEDYELVFWPDGQEGFGHEVTSFPLEKSHARLQCRQCHDVKHMVDPGAWTARGKDLHRTYLGLEARCEACHQDVHQGQFQQDQTARDCTVCHDAGQWKPAPLFDHAASAFPLAGKHQQVDCAKCHKAEATAGQPVTRFVPVAHQSCADCHQDPHTGTLGPDCNQCHDTSDWKKIRGAGFDHDRTRYPLRGRHAQVRCEQCHRQDQEKPRFAVCTDCHRDVHRGAELGRPALTACESCHTVEGFRPAQYTMERHQQSAFPLLGAHRATPCVACHRPADTPGTPVATLVLAHERCTACHRDPHPRSMARLAAAPDQGCAACHDQESWRVPAFDHGRTGFVLDGGHARSRCNACHQNENRADFSGLQTACAACHEDIHRGQFAGRRTGDGKHIACQQCHVTGDWFAEKFDHETDSRFPLRGGHERTPCVKCHLPEEKGNQRRLHYRPVPVTCKECHTGTVPGAAAKEQP
jgi:hypothetical protein